MSQLDEIREREKYNRTLDGEVDDKVKREVAKITKSRISWHKKIVEIIEAIKGKKKK